jgi:hypothetical protein
MSTTYYRDNKEYTTRELVATYYKGVSLPKGYDFTKDGASVVFPTPKPECGELERAVRDGVTTDANGNTVQKWKVVDMFTSDLLDEDGVTVLKTIAEQEAEYLAKLQTQEIEQKINTFTTTIDNYIQSKIDDYNNANGLKLADVNSLMKYTIDNTYTHYPFCMGMIQWNIQVWETARAIQTEVLAGNRDEPTPEELLAELPELTY